MVFCMHGWGEILHQDRPARRRGHRTHRHPAVRVQQGRMQMRDDRWEQRNL
jgi:hypothetical protein